MRVGVPGQESRQRTRDLRDLPSCLTHLSCSSLFLSSHCFLLFAADHIPSLFLPLEKPKIEPRSSVLSRKAALGTSGPRADTAVLEGLLQLAPPPLLAVRAFPLSGPFRGLPRPHESPAGLIAFHCWAWRGVFLAGSSSHLLSLGVAAAGPADVAPRAGLEDIAERG